jgi:hypothetical protein
LPSVLAGEEVVVEVGQPLDLAAAPDARSAGGPASPSVKAIRPLPPTENCPPV